MELGELSARYKLEGLQQMESVVAGMDVVGFFITMGSFFAPDTETEEEESTISTKEAKT